MNRRALAGLALASGVAGCAGVLSPQQKAEITTDVRLAFEAAQAVLLLLTPIVAAAPAISSLLSLLDHAFEAYENAPSAAALANLQVHVTASFQLAAANRAGARRLAGRFMPGLKDSLP